MPSTKSSTPNKLAVVAIVLAIVGFADASYLTWQHYAHQIPPCTIKGCETVLTSKYSQIGPFPVSIFGAGYYVVMIVLAAMLLEGVARVRPWLMMVVSGGLLFTLWLTYLQAFVIHAWCQYCLLSAGVTTALFITVMFLRPPSTVTTNSERL